MQIPIEQLKGLLAQLIQEARRAEYYEGLSIDSESASSLADCHQTQQQIIELFAQLASAEQGDIITYQNVGTVLRQYRKAAGMTLQEVASKSGDISVSFLSDIERGWTKPSLSMLCGLCQFYGVQLRTLPVLPVMRPRAQGEGNHE